MKRTPSQSAIQPSITIVQVNSSIPCPADWAPCNASETGLEQTNSKLDMQIRQE
jgi:hypothetical protein